MSALPKLFQTPSTAEANVSLQSRIDWLNKVRLFEDIRGVGGAVEQVAKLMEIKTFQKGVAIISEGDDGTSAFFLISGSIKSEINPLGTGAGSGGNHHGLAFEHAERAGIGRCGDSHRSPLGSRGNPRPRSAIRLRWIWLVPP